MSSGLKNFVASILIFSGGFVLNFYLNKYLSGHLELESFGDFRVALAIATIASLVVIFGGQGTARRFIPQYISSQKFPLIKGFLLHFLMMAAALGVAFAILGHFVALVIEQFGLEALSHEIHESLILTPLMAISVLAIGSTQALQRTSAAVVPNEIFKPALFLVFVLIALQLGAELRAIDVVYIFFAVMLILVVIQYAQILKFLPFSWGQTQAQYDRPEWHSVSVPLLLSALANALLDVIEVLAIEIIHADEAAVGAFALLVFMASVIWMNYFAILNVVSPQVSLYADDKAGLQSLFKKSFGYLLISNVLIAAVLCVFSEQILTLLNPELVSYEPWLILILCAAAFNASIEIASPFVRFGGHQQMAAKLAILLFIFCLVVTPIAVVFFGIEGAICAYVLTRFLRGIGYYAIMHRHVGVTLIG